MIAPVNVSSENGRGQVARKDVPFLEKVMLKAGLPDIFDARDLTVVVYRTLRDLLPTEEADRVEGELREQASADDNPALRGEIAELWHDTNPLVAWLSRVRGPLNIDRNSFLFRIENEGGLPEYVHPEVLVRAVFSATRDELSSATAAEVRQYLPAGLQDLWDEPQS